MVEQTSLKAYYEEVLPSLCERQVEVYKALQELGSASNMMIADNLGWSINRVTPRVKELRDMSPPLISLDNIGCCKVTGRKAKYWKAER